MWVMEFLVLALIAYEVGSDVLHRQKMHRWHDALFGFMAKGQKLHWNKPDDGPPYGEPSAEAWENSVKAWIRETSEFLQRSSPKAAAWFLQDSTYYEVSQNVFFWDTALFERINHLRSIMERLDVYF
jgi:hypothetical protein